MRTGTILKSYEFFVAAAAIAAHASFGKEGFRQRDVRFLIELFSNWVERTFDGPLLPVSNTQVQRYLEELVTEGYARRFIRRNRPRYRLVRTGLIELLQRLIPETLCSHPEHFFFLHYFIRDYRPRIEKLIADEGKQFPLALKLEVEALLDVDALIKQQLRCAELELKKLEERISDNVKGSKLATRLYAQKLPLLEVATEIEKRYPYELNSQKPLTELISEVPEDLGRWELETGAAKRVEHLWTPARSMLLSYIQILKKLETD